MNKGLLIEFPLSRPCARSPAIGALVESGAQECVNWADSKAVSTQSGSNR